MKIKFFLIFILSFSLAVFFAYSSKANKAIISISNVKGGIEVIVKLDKPVDMLKFSISESLQDKSWIFKDSHFKIENGVLSSASENSFSEVKFYIYESIADGEYDRMYTPIIISKSGVKQIHAGQFLFDNVISKLYFRLDATEFVYFNNKVHNILIDEFLDTDNSGYLLKGKFSTYNSADFSVHYAPETPSWIIYSIINKTQGIIDKNTNLFSDFDVPINIMVSFDEGLFNYRGDVHNHGMRLNFTGSGWQDQNIRNSDTAMIFIAHELTHFWIGNSQSISVVDGIDENWLLEGITEFLSLNILFDNGILSKESYINYFNSLFTSCQSQAFFSKKSILDLARSGYYYDCGAFISFLYEIVHNKKLASAVYQSYMNTGSISLEGLNFEKKFLLWLSKPIVSIFDICKIFQDDRCDSVKINPKEFQFSLAREIVRLALKYDCKKSTLSSSNGKINLSELDCKNLPSTMELESINDIPYSGDMASLLKSINRFCANTPSVSFKLKLNQYSLMFPCSRIESRSDVIDFSNLLTR